MKVAGHILVSRCEVTCSAEPASAEEVKLHSIRVSPSSPTCVRKCSKVGDSGQKTTLARKPCCWMSNMRREDTNDSNCNITVLRLGHRLVRDTRTSTHAALVARAFGAKKILMAGADEDDTMRSIERVNSRWGGEFQISQVKNWREVVKKWSGVVVHLTMYGEELDEAMPKIRKELESSKEKNLLIVIGAEKVPAEIFSLANYNVAVGNQPHSEVAALAIVLDRFFRGQELFSTFPRAKIRVKPSERGKKIEFITEN